MTPKEAFDAVASLKRYIFGVGHSLGLCKADQVPKGPVPTPKQVEAFIEKLLSLYGLSSPHPEKLRRFLAVDSARLNRGQVASGLLITMPFDKSVWQNAATDADHALNALKLELLRRQPNLELPWSGPKWEALSGLPRHLLAFMHDKEEASIPDVYKEVWGDDYNSVNDDNKLHTAKSRANSFLSELGWPRTLYKPMGENVIRWTPPPSTSNKNHLRKTYLT